MSSTCNILRVSLIALALLFCGSAKVTACLADAGAERNAAACLPVDEDRDRGERPFGVDDGALVIEDSGDADDFVTCEHPPACYRAGDAAPAHHSSWQAQSAPGVPLPPPNAGGSRTEQAP